MNEVFKENLIARWESKSGKHWADMLATTGHPRYFTYTAPGCGGSFGEASLDASLKAMQEKVDDNFFQPDANKTPMEMVCPQWAFIVRVDTLIECYEINNATNKELLEKVPDAYGGEAPGEDDWPEPDAKRDEPYKLDKHWSKLSKEARLDIVAAYERNER